MSFILLLFTGFIIYLLIKAFSFTYRVNRTYRQVRDNLYGAAASGSRSSRSQRGTRYAAKEPIIPKGYAEDAQYEELPRQGNEEFTPGTAAKTSKFSSQESQVSDADYEILP